MPRRKQTAPKRMKYEEGKGEVECKEGEGEEDGEGSDEEDQDASGESHNESEAEDDENEADEQLKHKKPSVREEDSKAERLSPVCEPASPARSQNSPHISTPPHNTTIASPDPVKQRLDIITPPPLVPQDRVTSPVRVEMNPLSQMEQMESVIRRISAEAVMSRKERLLRERVRHKEDILKMPLPREHKVTHVKDNVTSRSLSQPLSVVVPKSTPTMPKSAPSNERSSPRSLYLNPFEPDHDEPLDLSKKPKKFMPKIHQSSNKQDAPKSVGRSSLESLEKKFGANSYFEGVNPKLQPHRSPLYSAFGGNMFTTALYSTPPLPVQEPTMYKSNRTFWPRMVSNQTETHIKSYTSGASSSPKTPPMNDKSRTHGESVSHSRSLTPATVMKEESRGSNCSASAAGIKHTNLVCSCKKQYETLYDLTVHMQKTGHTPTSIKAAPETGEYPKLVRGQDMWLNQGSEQTRQILRCMQCGESFKSLPELTIHMMKTRHYTNIVGSESAKKQHKCSAYCDKCPGEGDNVFKCKVCNDSYSDMEGLANHMVLSGHHRKSAKSPGSSGGAGGSSGSGVGHDGGSGTANSLDGVSDSQPATPATSPSLRPALPPTPPHGAAGSVPSIPHHRRRLTNGSDLSVHSDDSMSSDDRHLSSGHDVTPSSPIPERSTIRCENCAERIDTDNFVEHVRACVKNKVGIHNDTLPNNKMPENGEEHNSVHESDRESENGQKENKEIHSPLRSNTSTPLRRSTPPDSSREENEVRSRDSPTMPVLHSTTPDPPEPEGSALKAMENFIERSFTLGLPKSGLLGSKPSINGKMSSMTGAPGRHHCPLPDSTALTFEHSHNHHKYLNPDLPSPNALKAEKSEIKEEVTDSPGVKSERNTPLSPEKVQVKEEDSDKKPDEKDEIVKPLQQKYLTSDETDSVDSAKSNGSALESLQGLVYGKAFTTEHPLDSLQKLIHNTDGLCHAHKPNGSQSIITGTATLQPGMPSTVILVNPIVTVVPHSSASPAVQINISTHDSTPTTQCSPTSSLGKGVPPMLLLESEADQSGDFRCQACNRTFASKGSYRYHLSRCHLSSVKKCELSGRLT